MYRTVPEPVGRVHTGPHRPISFCLVINWASKENCLLDRAQDGYFGSSDPNFNHVTHLTIWTVRISDSGRIYSTPLDPERSWNQCLIATMASINLATMASTNTANKSTRFFPSHPHHSATFCTRIHQIAALALVVATFFLTRLFDHSLGPCSSPHFNSFADVNRQYDGVLRFGDSVGWPDQGYGTHLNLKIYVYDENEIEGLKLLLYGREGKISPEACIKGQWGTQVI